jgi:hypothetical protein
MFGIVSVGRATVIAALMAFAVSPVAAAMMVFDCTSGADSKNCALDNARLTVEVLDAGGGQVAFVFANDDVGRSIVEHIYVGDETGTLAGPPEILNNDGTVVFERISGRTQLTDAAVARLPFKSSSDLSVAALQPSRELGINPGESLGLVFAITPGRTISDVLDDLGNGHLRFGVSTVAVTGGGRGSLVSQARLTDAP